MLPQSTDDVVTTMLYRKPHFRFWMVHSVFVESQLSRVLSLLMAIAVYEPTSPMLPLHRTKKELTLQSNSADTWSGRQGAVGWKYN